MARKTLSRQDSMEGVSPPLACTASEQVNDLVYVSGEGTVSRADASGAATSLVVGYVLSKPTTTSCRVSVQPGPVTGASGLATGQPVYLSAAIPGAVTATAPTIKLLVGIALSETSWFFYKDFQATSLGDLTGDVTAGDIDAGSRTISNVEPPLTGDQAANKEYVDGITAFKHLASTLHLVGNATVASINGLSPSIADSYVVTDTGVVNPGALSVSVGDVIEYSGFSWVLLRANTGGFVQEGTRAILSTQTTLVSPYTDLTDKGKIVLFDGVSNTGADTGESHEGAALFIEPSGDSILAGQGYFLSEDAPSGVWTKFTSEVSGLVTFTCTASESVHDLVYISGDDTVAQASAGSDATSDVIGWVYSKPSAVSCLVSRDLGPVASVGLTAGLRVFLSDVAGSVSNTPGTVIVEVGVAKSATSFVFTGAKIGIV